MDRISISCLVAAVFIVFAPGAQAGGSGSMEPAGGLFVRDAFSDDKIAGYRFENGFYLGGWIASEENELATASIDTTRMTFNLGQRVTLHREGNWHGFWDADLSFGMTRLDTGSSTSSLNHAGLGAYIGAEVMLADGLSLGARVGAGYDSEEVSDTRTDTRIAVGLVDLELTWKW